MTEPVNPAEQLPEVPPPEVPPSEVSAPAAPATPEAPATPSEGGGATIPTWLVAAIVAVVVVVVGVVLALLVFGGDDEDEGGGLDDIEGELPDQVSTDDADTPVVQMLAETAWDLDRSTLTTRFGNTCSYQGPESFLACTLIGGDPNRRVELPGVDLANTSPISTGAVDPGLEVADGAELVGSSFAGCPSSVRLTGADEPIGPGPAVCVQTDQSRVFAVYLTHVTPEGALSFVAVEVTP